MVDQLRLFLSESFLYLAMLVIPKNTQEAYFLAKCLKEYLDKVENKK